MKFIKLTVAEENISQKLKLRRWLEGADPKKYEGEEDIIEPSYKIIIPVENIVEVFENKYKEDDDKGITSVVTQYNNGSTSEYNVEESIDTIYRWIELGY